MTSFRIINGHWPIVSREIPSCSIQVCVTSPPYWGLRSYGTEPQVWGGNPLCSHDWQQIKIYKDSWRRGEVSAGFYSDRQDSRQERTHATTEAGRWTHTEECAYCGAWKGELGQEMDPTLYTQNLVECFSHVWRVLRPDGVLFVNIGDASYKSSARDIPSFTPKRGMKVHGLKEKDIVGLPWIFALAMRNAGWYWRSEIIWNKVNALPESVNDRPTKSHEPLLMFTKRKHYFYDKWAVTEEPTGNAHPRAGRNGDGRGKKEHSEGRANNSFKDGTLGILCPGGRNRGSVWTIRTQGYEDKHFASYPEELVEICIKAGSSEAGGCASCLSPWRRLVLQPEKPRQIQGIKLGLEDRWRLAAEERGIDIDRAITGDSITLGWMQTCKCPYPGPPVPCAVLDPFSGRGTTGIVAVRFGRNAVLCDIKPEYADMIRKNVSQEQPLWVSENQL